MPPPSVSLRQLEYFVAVAELGSIAAAARDRHVSQSAISLAISQMESQLEVDVFRRSPSKRLTLTPAGQRLVVDARRILTLVEDFSLTARDFGQTLEGRLTVGCPETLTSYLLPRVLGEFGARHPGLEIDLVEGSVEHVRKLLDESVCEVAVTYWPNPVSGYTARPLYSIRPHVMLPPTHRFAGEPVVRLADLIDETLVLLDSPPSAEQFLSMFESFDLEPRVIKRTSNVETLRSLVAAGVGYAPILNRQQNMQAANGQRFTAAEIAEPVRSMPVFLVHSERGRLTRRAQAFAEYCLTELYDGESLPSGDSDVEFY